MILEKPRAGAPDIDVAAFAAVAAKVGAPALVPEKYPRAWPIETFCKEDGSRDVAFVFDGEWRIVPEAAFDHAAVEVGVAAEAFVSPLNYAAGAVFFLEALRRSGWAVSAPKGNSFDPNRCMTVPDDQSTA